MLTPRETGGDWRVVAHVEGGYAEVSGITKASAFRLFRFLIGSPIFGEKVS
jgi:hypothetical protein